MRRVRTTLIVLALFAAPAALHAQRPIHLGVAGGLSLPQGTFGNVYRTGYNGHAFLELTLPALPLGLRAGVEYEAFGGERFEPYTGTKLSLLGASAEATYDIASMPMSPVGPYLIAGAGLYEVTNRGSDGTGLFNAEDREFGWHLGIGSRLRLGPLNAFVEARYRSIRLGEDATMLPLSVGLRF